MNWKEEYKKLLIITGIFLIAYFLPVEKSTFTAALIDALVLVKWYAQEHVLLCLIPAFFIAGVISVFISQASVIKYFGANAKKWLAYLVASISGTVLAVCSCTILPLFSSIYKRGAGLGPAVTFLYSGPAINILAIILTARILGTELGIARIIGAVVFSIVIGLIMQLIYKREEKEKANTQLLMPEQEENIPLWRIAIHFFILVGILVFANWGKPAGSTGFWYTIWSLKWWITSLFGLLLCVSLNQVLKIRWFYIVMTGIPVILTAILFKANPLVPFSAAILGLSILISLKEGEAREWMSSTLGFAKQILPLLAIGVLIAGFLLGSPDGGKGIVPSSWISELVGGNSILSNLFASVIGAFMYFATLTEVPIIQGLIANGMGKGPALALLLAGPALSLPNMLVIRSVMGTQKTAVFVALVVVMATMSGFIFGTLF